MTDRVREELLGHVLGVLDDSEQEPLLARLEREPVLRRELALLRRQLEPLEAARRDDAPPPGLAERTCRFVFSRARPTPLGRRRRSMTPTAASSGWLGRLSWIDVAVTVGIAAAAVLAIVPAIQCTRFHGQQIACQENLRDVGAALMHYSDRHDGYFPRIPTRGKLAAAGVYAPTLLRDQYLGDAWRVVCPGSPLAARGEFRPPSLDEVESAADDEVEHLRERMGGSYGYGLGHLSGGVYRDTKNLHRTTFALMADAPTFDQPGHRSLNHGGRGQNVLFEDGAVRFLTVTRLASSGDDIFCNDEGQIAAGVHADDAVIAPSRTPPVHYVGYGTYP